MRASLVGARWNWVELALVIAMSWSVIEKDQEKAKLTDLGKFELLLVARTQIDWQSWKSMVSELAKEAR